MFVSASGPPVTVIVCGVEKTPFWSNDDRVGGEIADVSGLVFVLWLAQSTAVRIVPTSIVSAVVETRYDDDASKAPTSAGGPASIPAGPRSAPR